jgi:hypothetical protein
MWAATMMSSRKALSLGGYDKRATADVSAPCLSWSLSFWDWVYSR